MRILIVDEHPITVDGYINILSSSSFYKKNNPVFTKTFTYQKALINIEQTLLFNENYDIAIIDYSETNQVLKSFQDANQLVRYLEDKMPNCKLLIVTNHTEIIKVFEIAKKIKNHAFAIKSDLNSKNLPLVIEQVLNNEEYKSEKVREAILTLWKNDILIDDTNRQILAYIIKGYKSKDICSILDVSQATINKKIASLKNYFDSKDEKELIQTINKLGFIKLFFLEFAMQF